MEKFGTLELKGMHFHAFHGVEQWEKQEGREFTVDFRAEMDLSAAAESDRVEDTVDYGRIHGIVAEEMAVTSDLIEHVAGRIVLRIEREFPEIGTFSVTVSKLDPPVSGRTDCAAVTLRGGSSR